MKYFFQPIQKQNSNMRKVENEEKCKECSKEAHWNRDVVGSNRIGGTADGTWYYR